MCKEKICFFCIQEDDFAGVCLKCKTVSFDKKAKEDFKLLIGLGFRKLQRNFRRKYIKKIGLVKHIVYKFGYNFYDERVFNILNQFIEY